MVGTPRPARVGEDEDTLFVILKGLRFGKIGGTGAVFHRKTVDPVVSAPAHDAARAAGHLRDLVGSETLDDLVERARDGQQRGEVLDQTVAALDRVATLHRLAVAKDGPRADIAVFVAVFFEQLRRERVGEIVEHILPRRDVDLNVVPVRGRNLCKAPFHQRLAGRYDLDDGGMARGKVALDMRDQRGRLHAGDKMAEEALLRGFERRARGGFGGRVQCAGRAGDTGARKARTL